MRVPTLDVSVVDLTVNLAKPATYAEICAAMKEEMWIRDRVIPLFLLFILYILKFLETGMDWNFTRPVSYTHLQRILLLLM